MKIHAKTSVTDLVVHTATLGTVVAGSAYICAVTHPDVTLGDLRPRIGTVALGALGLTVAARFIKACTAQPNRPKSGAVQQRREPVTSQKRSIALLVIGTGVLGGLATVYFLNHFYLKELSHGNNN